MTKYRAVRWSAILLLGSVIVAGCSAAPAAQPPSPTLPVGAGAAGPSATARASETPAATPSQLVPCSHDDITVTSEEYADGFGFITLTNTGAAACTVVGFLDVVTLDEDGAAVGARSPEYDDTVDQQSTIVKTLQPGDVAYAEVKEFSSAHIGVEAGQCDPLVTSTSKAVTLPGDDQAIILARPARVFCTGLGWMASVNVGPITAEKIGSGS